MQIDAFLKLIEATRFATTIRDSIWMFPIIESIHVISFTLVVGTIAVIDLRLLGLASTQRSFQRMSSDILKWTWAAFALTVATGLTMFSTNAANLLSQSIFQDKDAVAGTRGRQHACFRDDRGPNGSSAGTRLGRRLVRAKRWQFCRSRYGSASYLWAA